MINGQERRLPVAGSTINGVFYDGIYEKCAPVPVGQEQPGDLVFFAGTFDASYRRQNLTHVGVYVGDETFLACGSSCGVSYQSYDTVCDRSGHAWRDDLFGYGRLAIAQLTNK